MTTEVENSVTATQSAVGMGAIAALVISVLNMSSPNAMWAMVNQIQSFMLMIALNVYIPNDIIQYITAQNSFQFSFDFIPINKISFVDISMDWFETDTSSESKYEVIGINSNSTFINVLPNLTSLLIIMCVHL